MVDGILTVVLLVAGILRWLQTSEYAMQQSLIDARRDQRLGGPGQGAMFDQALESGVVPSRANRMAWIRELKDDHEVPAFVRFLDVIIAGSFVGKLTNTILTESLDRLLTVTWFAVAGAAAFFGVWLLINRIRRDKDPDHRARLLTTLESQTSAYRVVSDLSSRRRFSRIARRPR